MRVFVGYLEQIVGKSLCLDALFICLFSFVAFRVTFDGLCC